MTTLWRISNYTDLSGEGARGASARWHSEGRLIVYLAESPAGALLERIVHLIDQGEGDDLPRFYQLLKVAAPDATAVKALNTKAKFDWRERIEFTQQLGDAWLASGETPLARVPSVIAPHTWNVLLNPEHPDAKKVRIEAASRERFDPRLFQLGKR